MEKVIVELKNGDQYENRKGVYNSEDNQILCRTWHNFRPITHAYLVVTPYHFKLLRKGRTTIRSIKVNDIDGRSFPYDGDILFHPTDAESTTAIRLLGNRKLWNSLGGRPLDKLETLIYLLAGYGAFRWAEITLIRIFAPNSAVTPP